MPDQNSPVQKSKRGLLRFIFSRTMLITLLLLFNFAVMFFALFELMQNLPILFGSVVAFTAVMELVILNSRDDIKVKLTWAIITAVFPLVGAVLYFWVRYDLGNRMNRRLIDTSIQISQPFVPEQTAVFENIRNEDPTFQSLASYLQRQADAPVYNHCAVTYFPLGEHKFREMLVQLEKAEKFIFMEYFIISEGHMWNSILEILERKAAAGVEVRVLYDGMNAYTNLPYSYPEKLQKKGIACKMHAPVRPFISSHYNNRDHRKILVIDGHTAFTGGINLEDCYINEEVRYGHWKDTAVMIKGDAAQSFTLMFLQMWNATERNKEFARYLKKPVLDIADPGFVIPYADTPTDREQVGKMVYLHLLNQAKDYIWIMTPYLILDPELSTAVQFAAKRGVDVRIILPHIPDKQTAFALAKNNYPELLEAGVKIYEYTPGFVHAKVVLCDDIHAVVGTINLDYRSLYHHFECAAYLYRVPALSDIRRDFAETEAKCQRVTEEDVKNRPLLSRLMGQLLNVFAPLM